MSSAQNGSGEAGSQFSNVLSEFDRWREDPNLAVAVAAIKALTSVIRLSEASTMMGLEIELKAASDVLKHKHPTSISLSAGCDLFLRYVTRTSATEAEEFAVAKARLIERGERFSEISLKARRMIAILGNDFIRDGCTILSHGYSRVVLSLYKQASLSRKHFNVILTEGRPDSSSGLKMAKEISEMGIPVSVVLDSGIGYIMERVGMVLIGADAVLESGGIMNTLGTYPVAMVANHHAKPVYVAVESYKFARMFPLDQKDLVPTRSFDFGADLPEGVAVEHSEYDYTPPEFLSLLITDLGILTPPAISDELIQLYL